MLQTYDDDEISELMEFVEQSKLSKKASADPGVNDVATVLESLYKLTTLYDNGVIDSKTYVYQKESLVRQLQEPAPEKFEDNLTVRRKHKRRMGDAKIYLYIDGKKNCEVEDPVTLTLSEGEYIIQFRVAALRTRPRTIVIESHGDKYSFVVDHQLLGLVDTMYGPR